MKASHALALSLLILLVLNSACGVAAPTPNGSTARSTEAPTATSLSETSTTVPSPASVKPSATIAPLDTAPPPSPSPYAERDLHVATDETEAIIAFIPVAWHETRTIPWTDDRGRTIGTTFMASTDIERFRDLQVEGVAISVSRRLPMGYIQLLDEEYETYLEICNHPFSGYSDFQNSFYRGKWVTLNDCYQIDNSWLSILSVVSIEDPQGYVARVLAYDMPPIFGGEFRRIMMQFQVLPENLP